MFLKVSRIFVIIIILLGNSLPVFSQEGKELLEKPFFRVNSDLKRIGVDEIARMGTVDLESANYRIDPDFTLGSGDILNVDFWGKIEATHKVTVDSYGNILIPLVGRVSVIGLTLNEARVTVGRAIDQKYSNVRFDLNVSDVRDIRVNVLGNVKNPGVYALSPFSRVADALVLAGGSNREG
ncbi:MAG: polysaccharide biosynthesis/export family protein, partial [Candidatus Omnitrophota bacterium]